MNFDEAIKAHSDWKIKLTQYLKKPDGSLKAETIAPDNLCALGKWIHGEGQKFAQFPEFKELQSIHAEFHKAAADVVRRADSGQQVSAEVTLGAKSKYGEVSSKVVSLIMKMKLKVGTKAA